MMPATYIANSPMGGRGLFAARDLEAGEQATRAQRPVTVSNLSLNMTGRTDYLSDIEKKVQQQERRAAVREVLDRIFAPWSGPAEHGRRVWYHQQRAVPAVPFVSGTRRPQGSAEPRPPS